MATRKKAPTTPTPVEAITHEDKRANLPTADGHDFVSPEVEKPIPVLYPRDPSLDPQLVWKGKDELDGEDLVADAPPIYIQEKIDPRVLIENLRDTAARPEDEPELTLFESFDGLGDLDLVEYYEHEANWSNRMILGDSLNVMASLAEREAVRGKVQTIYIDPPYGIRFGSNWQVSTRRTRVSDGKLADATREVEQIKAFRDTWELGIHSYLAYLRDRLAVARDLLTESGSVFVQIGDDNVHLVRALMDEVFGSENFISLITFKKTSAVGSFAGGTNVVASTCDYVVWYALNRELVKYRQLYKDKEIGGAGAGAYTWIREPDGRHRRATPEERDSGESTGRFFRPSPLTSETVREAQTTVFPVELDGETYVPGKGGWKTNPQGMERLRVSGRLLATGRSLNYVRFLDDFPAFPVTNLWEDTQSGSGMDKIYVVQTNTKVVERCLLMTSDPGDLVLDPTCGSGTAAFVAERWGRRWVTIDTSRVALALARQRLMGARFPYFLLADSGDGRAKESELSAQPLPPAEATDDIRHGFVFQRVQHLTLKSIANNPDTVAGMPQQEIDAAIARHAEFELLVDKPYEDKRKIRVAGPFTVESLSPHRSLAFAGSAVDEAGAVNEDEPDASHGDASFEQTIVANLRAAGIQNGLKGERLTFDSLDNYAGAYIQAVGEREDVEDGAPGRVGITIGPQYGTVGPSFIKDAAREANKDASLDLLCVLGFAFDPNVLGTGDGYEASDEGFAEVAAVRRLGRVPVLLVRMNADLVMGDELKKTGAGNLFTVFGEPDIAIEEQDDQLRVVLRGIDVYDPNTGETRTNETDQIALWMIDTAYNGESFFVRHCYFTGNQDPYARLKRALKAEIDEEAWDSLYKTESRPFARPESGRIAVKVINDYGDEVMKVFSV